MYVLNPFPVSLFCKLVFEIEFDQGWVWDLPGWVCWVWVWMFHSHILHDIFIDTYNEKVFTYVHPKFQTQTQQTQPGKSQTHPWSNSISKQTHSLHKLKLKLDNNLHSDIKATHWQEITQQANYRFINALFVLLGSISLKRQVGRDGRASPP
jgi:hypothetical protein